jgi:protein-L-isoaspartate O-methyltransferase
MNPILFYFHKKQNPILWSKTSEAFLAILTRYAQKTDTVLEVGSGTGHVSYMLAKQGYHVSLNEIRKETLDESQHRFEQHGAPQVSSSRCL